MVAWGSFILQNHNKTMANHGNTFVAKPWQTMAKPFQNYNKTMADHGDTIAKSCKTITKP